jgi:hypothetical protein
MTKLGGSRKDRPILGLASVQTLIDAEGKADRQAFIDTLADAWTVADMVERGATSDEITRDIHLPALLAQLETFEELLRISRTAIALR